MFLLIMNFTLFVLLLKEYIRIKHPKLHTDTLVNFMYYNLYIFTICEQLLNEHLYPLYLYNEIVTNNLEFILDDHTTKFITDTEMFSIDKHIPTEYLFAFYTCLNNDNTVRKKRIYNRLPDVYDCDETNYKFVLVEVKYEDFTLKLNFNDSKTTYYVVNNEFDSNVIRYLVESELKIVLPEQYTVRILDNTVTMFEFNETQVLKLNKDDYQVFTADKYVNDSENDDSTKVE